MPGFDDRIEFRNVFRSVEWGDRACPLSGHLRDVNAMKILILLFRVFLVWLSLSVIDMFAKQFGYGAWDSGPWGYLLLAVQIAVGLVVWNLSARFKRE